VLGEDEEEEVVVVKEAELDANADENMFEIWAPKSNSGGLSTLVAQNSEFQKNLNF